MFGSKFKTWMENHIVRAKKKTQHDKEKISQSAGKGPILESSESLAQSDTGISSGSQQVLSSSNADNNEGYCTTTMESNRSGMAHCHTAVNLSSPESAYSTGYSTDGTSPGGTGPPEYYINIRTGKHYFPSPAPTPTSPQPTTAFSQLVPLASSSTSFPANGVGHTSQRSTQRIAGDPQTAMLTTPSASLSTSTCNNNSFVPSLRPFVRDSKNKKPSEMRSDLSSSVPSHFELFHFSKSPVKKVPPKSPLSTLKFFLKSPKQDKVKPKPPDESRTLMVQNKKKPTSPVKNKKWYKQPFQKFGHRRTDFVDKTVPKNEVVKKGVPFDKNIYFLTKESASPRQRNRIRTNPWLPPTEPVFSQNFQTLQMSFPPNPVRNRSCTNTPLQNRKVDDVETLPNLLRSINMNVKSDDSKEYLANLEKVFGRHIGQKLLFEPSDHSEEDLTLNEMMGTYNESYVYEKETDILSDSDPTDCEDYASDSEADNGGDEQDSHDDELDFIDDGSTAEGENSLKNTGKCTYHDIYAKKNHFLGKISRHHSRNEADIRKSFKKNAEMKRKKSKEDKKKKSFRKSLRSNDLKLFGASNTELEPAKLEPINMSKLLLQRADGKLGSKSADGTPACLRRKKELMQTHIGDRSDADNGLFLINGVLEDDIEADKKYNELILEAENIFVTLKNSPDIRARKLADAKKEEKTLDIWKKTEILCTAKLPEARKPEVTTRRNLGLSLVADSKKPKELCFGGKNSFRAKSSTHSPLDPLGPTFKNFTIFKEVDKKISSSSSDDSESCKREVERKPESTSGWSTSNVVPIAFQSVDLGKPLTTYCPQSEPVKRKVYSCSKTYDQLVKRFESESKVVQQEGKSRFKKRNESRQLTPRQEEKPDIRNFGGNFFYNPLYSPYSSPATSRKCIRESPNVSQSCRFDVDAIR